MGCTGICTAYSFTPMAKKSTYYGGNMKVAEKQIYKNKNGKVIRITDCFGNNRYCLLDKNGNYIREIPSIFNVKSMKELFPNLAR